VISGVLSVSPAVEMIGEKTHLTVYRFEFANYAAVL